LTIKRRLFLSNILMLVMPIILTMLMFSCATLIFIGVTGIEDFRSFREGNVSYSEHPLNSYYISIFLFILSITIVISVNLALGTRISRSSSRCASTRPRRCAGN
jgi:hypothetical protein